VGAPSERGAERSDVAFDDVGVEAHRVYVEEDGVAQRAANRVEELIERMPRARLRGVRPEEEEQLVAAPAAPARRRQHGQQRQAATVVAMLPQHGLAVTVQQRECAERAKSIALRRRRLYGVVHGPTLAPRRQRDKKNQRLTPR
jgi:hypothetical protein